MDYIPGDQASFIRLYESSYNKILGRLRQMLPDGTDAEDCTQDAFVQGYKHWAEWKPTAPPEAWIMQIAKNGAISKLRSNSIRTVEETVRRFGLPKHSDPQDTIQANEILAMVNLLPPKQAAALIFKYWHGYTNRDMARLLNIPERTVASRIMAGKDRLRPQLEKVNA